MKPKTKRQKHIFALSQRFDDITDEDKRWAEDAIFDNYFVEVRNRYYCLECGHKWNSDDAELSKFILPTTCPECETTNLCHVNDWETDESKYEYWAIIDTMEEFQVVRMFFTEKYMKRKQSAEYWHREVMQHWIDKDGEVTSLTMRCHTMGHRYYDSWTSDSDLEPRTNSRNHQMRCSIIPYKIRPGRNTLPIIRRNGYKGYFKDEPPHYFFSTILQYPKAETLLKAGQDSLFKECVGLDSDANPKIEQYWDSICIAMRNDYVVEDAGDWLDYLGFLEELDKDLHNPHYICPDNFEQAHNRYNEKIRRIREKERREKNRKKMRENYEKYVESKGHFFDLEISAGDIKIVPLKSPEEFIEEGEKLHHCIGNSRYFKKENALILSARKQGEPIETVEVNLETLEVAQSRGLQNKATEHHEQIVDAVEDNMRKIASIVSRKNVDAMVADIEGTQREVAA